MKPLTAALAGLALGAGVMSIGPARAPDTDSERIVALEERVLYLETAAKNEGEQVDLAIDYALAEYKSCLRRAEGVAWRTIPGVGRVAVDVRDAHATAWLQLVDPKCMNNGR